MALISPYDNFPRLLNQPVRIHMAGWTSDTYKLQRNGWQISVEESHAIHRMDIVLRMALKHPELKLYGLTNPQIIDDAVFQYEVDFERNIELHVGCMATEIRVRREITVGDFSMFRPIDAKPHYEDTATAMVQERSLDDFKIFRALPQQEEIIIKPESVGELLDKIRSMQDPFQAEFREKKRKELRKFNREVNDYELGTNIVAQVATLV